MRKPNLIEIFLTIILVIIVFCSLIAQMIFYLEEGSGFDYSNYSIEFESTSSNDVDKLFDGLKSIAHREDCYLSIAARQKSKDNLILVGIKYGRPIEIKDVETQYIPFEKDNYSLIFMVDISMDDTYKKYNFDYENNCLYLDNGDSLIITGEDRYMSEACFNKAQGKPIPIVYVSDNIWRTLDTRHNAFLIEIYSDHHFDDATMEELNEVLSDYTVINYEESLHGPVNDRMLEITGFVAKLIGTVLLVLSSRIIFQYFSLQRRKNKIMHILGMPKLRIVRNEIIHLLPIIGIGYVLGFGLFSLFAVLTGGDMLHELTLTIFIESLLWYFIFVLLVSFICALLETRKWGYSK